MQRNVWKARAMQVMVLAAVALVLTACPGLLDSDASDILPDTGSVIGQVVVDQSYPVEAVTVRLGTVGRSTGLDADGEFSFEQVPDGSFSVTVTAPGYIDEVRSVTVSSGSSEQLDTIELEKLSAVYVSPDGNDSNNGVTPDTPVQTLPRALEVVQQYNAFEVKMASGTYHIDSMQVIDYPVALYGSYSDQWEQSSDDDPDTIITGTHQLFNFISPANHVMLSHLVFAPADATDIDGHFHWDATSTAINASHLNLMAIWNSRFIYDDEIIYNRSCALNLRSIGTFYLNHSEISLGTSQLNNYGLFNNYGGVVSLMDTSITMSEVTEGGAVGMLLHGSTELLLENVSVDTGDAYLYSNGIQVYDTGSADLIRTEVITGAAENSSTNALHIGNFASAKVRNSYIHAGSSGDQTVGISASDHSRIMVRHSTVIAGHGQEFSGGIKAHDRSQLEVYNSTVEGGIAENQVSVGIGLFHRAEGLIRNNHRIAAGQSINGWQAGIELNYESTATIVDNHEISAGEDGRHQYGIWIGPEVRNAVIRRNHDIHGGSGAEYESLGIRSETRGDLTVVDNNRIHGGHAGNDSIDMHANNFASATIVNNTFEGGRARNQRNVDMGSNQAGSFAIVRNNRIIGGESVRREDDSASHIDAINVSLWGRLHADIISNDLWYGTMENYSEDDPFHGGVNVLNPGSAHVRFAKNRVRAASPNGNPDESRHFMLRGVHGGGPGSRVEIVNNLICLYQESGGMHVFEPELGSEFIITNNTLVLQNYYQHNAQLIIYHTDARLQLVNNLIVFADAEHASYELYNNAQADLSYNYFVNYDGTLDAEVDGGDNTIIDSTQAVEFLQDNLVDAQIELSGFQRNEWANGDWSLMSDSQLINAGRPVYAAEFGNVVYDLNNVRRNYTPEGYEESHTIDVGAFEFAPGYFEYIGDPYEVYDSSQPIVFRYLGDADEVVVAGSFSNWEPSSTEFTMDVIEGGFELSAELEPGLHQYKFVIDGDWVTPADQFAADPLAAAELYEPVPSARISDGFGGYNSVLILK